MGYVGKVNAGGSEHLVGSTLYGTCDTAGSTAAKVVVCPDFTDLIEGVTIHVKFTHYNSASNNTTLNVNSTGAKPVMEFESRRAGGNAYYSWQDNSVVSFTYDGANWVMNDKNEYRFVFQNKTTTNTNYPMLLAYGTSNTVNQVNFAANITGNPSTGNIAATSFNGYTLAAASAKGVDTSISSGSTSANLPTTAAVASYVATQMGDVAGALVYKGTVSAESSLLDTALKKGWYYIVSVPSGSTSVSIAGEDCDNGDMVIVNTAGTYTSSTALAAATDIVQSNIYRISETEIDAMFA